MLEGWSALTEAPLDPEVEGSSLRHTRDKVDMSGDLASVQLDILYQEYQRAVGLIEAQWDRILRATAIGFSAASAILLLITGGQLGQDNRWLYWIAPILLTLIYTFVIQMMYHMSFASYYARDLEDDIAKRVQIPYFHLTSATARGLSSNRTGSPPLQATYGLSVLFACFLYLVVVGVCFVRLRSLNVPAWETTAFVFAQLFLAATMVWAAQGSVASLREEYERWKAVPARTAMETIPHYKRAATVWRLLGYAFLPRPVEFFSKGLGTAAAFVLTSIVLGANWSLDLLAVGLGVVVCVDFLAKQATYVWNDILDADIDRRHPHKSGTRVLAVLPTDTFGKLLFLFRTLAAFTVAFLLSIQFRLTWLPWLVVAIYIWQFLYDRWAKRAPVRRVLFAAIGYAERAAAGALAAMTVAKKFDGVLLVFVSIWIVVFMTMVLSEFWWAERRAVKAKKYSSASSVQVWFIEKGQRLQRIANLVLVFITFGIVYFYTGDTGQRQEPISQLLREVGEANARMSEAAQRFADAGFSPISAAYGFPQLSHEETSLTVIVLVALGLLSTHVVQCRMEMQAEQAIDGYPGEAYVGSEDRKKWLRGIGGLGMFFLFLVPPNLRFLVAGFFLPLLAAAYWEQLSYADITVFERLLHQKMPRLLVAIDHALFDPWSVRVAILPINGGSRSSRLDAERLAMLYESWGRCNKVSSCRAIDADHDRIDVVLSGSYSTLNLLVDETGKHKCLKSADIGAAAEYAYVYVMPLAAKAHSSLGTGLDVPCPQRDFLSVETPAIRTYWFDETDWLVRFRDGNSEILIENPEDCPTGDFSRFLEWIVSKDRMELAHLEQDGHSMQCR